MSMGVLSEPGEARIEGWLAVGLGRPKEPRDMGGGGDLVVRCGGGRGLVGMCTWRAMRGPPKGSLEEEESGRMSAEGLKGEPNGCWVDGRGCWPARGGSGCWPTSGGRGFCVGGDI